MVIVSDLRELEARRSDIDTMVAALEAERPQMGPAQWARLDLLQFVLASLDGRVDAAAHFGEAATAHAQGVVTSTSFVRSPTRLSPCRSREPTSSPSASSPAERVVFFTNRAYVLMTHAGSDRHPLERAAMLIERGLAVVDGERHRYTSVADRTIWANFVARTYELGITLAEAQRQEDLVVELIERARVHRDYPPISAPTWPPRSAAINTHMRRCFTATTRRARPSPTCYVTSL